MPGARHHASIKVLEVVAATVIVLAAGAASAQAAPGDLDASFSGDGRQITDFGGGEGGSGVAIQGDGRIVVVGGRDGDFAVARYTADGSLDTTFSGDGMQTTDLGGSDGARGVVIQGDGKLVAAGSSGSDFAVVRYEPDGSLDTTFSSDGMQTIDLGGSDSAGGVVVQGDGKILVAGSSGSDIALVRYTAEGALDATFSDDGTVTTDLGGSDGVGGVAIQADGKLLAGGWSDSDFALVRYDADGSLDTTFSNDGKQSTDFGGWDFGQAVAIQADGRIVAVGSSIPSDVTAGFSQFAVARYDTNGSLDTSFAADGRQTTSLDVEDHGHAVAIQADGKIVVAGNSYPDFTLGRGDFGLVRYDADGSLDTTFAGDGRLSTDFGGSEVDDVARGVAIDAAGRIVAAGATALGGEPGDFAVARYEGDTGATPPTNLTAPTISGSPIEGHTLTASSGTWSGATPITLTHHWRRCDSVAAGCTDIAGATATVYTLDAGDVGHTIRVRETATNAYGTHPVDSAGTAVVKAGVGIIAGTVRSASTGASIAGAAVNCGTGYSAKTERDGTYSIAYLIPGTYSCTASASRYRPSTRTVTIGAGQTTTADYSLLRR